MTRILAKPYTCSKCGAYLASCFLCGTEWCPDCETEHVCDPDDLPVR